MINIDLILSLFDENLNCIDEYSLESNESINNILYDRVCYSAKLTLNINGVDCSLCNFKYDKKSKQWSLTNPAPANTVSEKDVLWAKKTFMKSENLNDQKNVFWSLTDLRGHFQTAKAKNKIPPQKHQNRNSVDGMIEYLLNTGYIQR